MVAGVEFIEQDRVDGLGFPQAQRIDALAPPARDRRVIGGGDDAFARPPVHLMRSGLLPLRRIDASAKADLVARLAPLELPGIAMRQPVFGQFHLPAIADFLPEHAVHIADAIAISRHVHRRHAFHETSRQPTQATIAQRGVGLQRGDDVNIDTQRRQRGLKIVQHFHVGCSVAHQPADQEFQAEIINPPPLRLVGFVGGFDPGVDHPVADRQDDGMQPVMGLCGGGILADAIGQPLDDFAGQQFGIDLPRCGPGKFGLALKVHGVTSPC